MIKNPDLGFNIERHPYVWSQTEDSEPGGKKTAAWEAKVTITWSPKRGFFGNLFFPLVFSFYKMYIIHTFFQRFERLFQCNSQFDGSYHCLKFTQLLQKTENKFHRRLSAICCKYVEFIRRHAFLWQSHARILPVEGRMGRMLDKSTKNCNSALDWGH